MYIPPSFEETDLETLQGLIENYSFGLLVTQADGTPVATHIPFLLERGAGPHGTLVCHLARANPQWHDAQGKPALAIFSGPHAYISPTWYAAEHVVPTWNYVAVHAYGSLQVIHAPAEIRSIVAASVRQFEQTQPSPWELPADGEYLDKLLPQIVGIRLEIERLEGKWKLSQNHSPERQARVIDELRNRGDERAEAVADLMQERLKNR
ncbi:MAG: FMN-binding negative transcriptional regulator [Planctomycetes bacterium]|nr:FMN-binding negative transcriptional regulator [Planctomycetota bacterium]